MQLHIFQDPNNSDVCWLPVKYLNIYTTNINKSNTVQGKYPCPAKCSGDLFIHPLSSQFNALKFCHK